ncbi:MAG: AgmX/PglI C-terminal domain-containing protein [Oligoflexia bacterium]|nr:AgmX/PglI C-terminal domain-containing protein [Oligoflexia bacterium]
MIAVTSQDGRLLRSLPAESGKSICYNRLLGFGSKEALIERARNRQRHGFEGPTGELADFSFELAQVSGDSFRLTNPYHCQLEEKSGIWIVNSSRGTFHIRPLDSFELPPEVPTPKDQKSRLTSSILIMLLLPLIAFMLPKSQKPEATVIMEPIAVKVQVERVKPVTVGLNDMIPKEIKQARQVKRAIAQDLGFLGMLGRKDLTKAIGGAPTIKDGSPGAGAGGKEGSGGEYLMGIGQGLKRATVGNSGVAGLGGIGTKGAGGGQGGYGNTMIGSGDGKGLSTVALSDDVILEGGLDRSVVQATIAKYLSQVRACYEQGLKRNGGLAGQVTMAFEIGGQGQVNFADVKRSSLGDPEVENCIGQRMKDWKFPQPRGGVNVKVTYPFVLRSARG